jgi:hypothetical protein
MDLKALLRWAGLALCAGMALGIAARIAMRVVALQAEVPPGFSLGGSLEIVVFGVLVGTPVALLFWAGRRWLRLPAFSGVLVGLLLFAVYAAWPPPAARSALGDTPDTPILTAAVFAGAFAVYGIVLEVLWRMNRGRGSLRS